MILFFKMFAVSLHQGYHRIGKLTFKNPEDAGFVGKAPADEELPQVRRAAQVWLNDLENIPIFLALGIAYVLVNAAPSHAPWLFMTFTVARILHTLTYLLGLQPWRTIAYSVGIGCMIWMSVNILRALP